MRRQPMLIVTGAGRSGTSAVAQVLHESGCSMGDDLHEPTEFNPTGYFEDRRVCAVNDAILGACRLDRWFGYASRSEVLAAAEPYRVQMKRLAAAATGGWKDPRFCWTLEAWLPRLPQPPRLIVCLRSPRAVVDSTVRRYGQTGAYARRHVAFQWSRQYRRLLEVVRDYGLQALCVEYDALLAGREAAVARLAEFAGRTLDASCLDATLRHESAPVAQWHRSLYREVRALGPASTLVQGPV